MTKAGERLIKSAREALSMTATDTSADWLDRVKGEVATRTDEDGLVYVLAEDYVTLAAEVEALEARCELLREGQSTAHQRGYEVGRDKERERAARSIEGCDTLHTGAYFAAAIRKGNE